MMCGGCLHLQDVYDVWGMSTLARRLFTDLTVLWWSQIVSVSKELRKHFKPLPFLLLLGLNYPNGGIC